MYQRLFIAKMKKIVMPRNQLMIEQKILTTESTILVKRVKMSTALGWILSGF